MAYEFCLVPGHLAEWFESLFVVEVVVFLFETCYLSPEEVDVDADVVHGLFGDLAVGVLLDVEDGVEIGDLIEERLYDFEFAADYGALEIVGAVDDFEFGVGEIDDDGTGSDDVLFVVKCDGSFALRA